MHCLYRHVRLDKNEVFYVGISRKHKSRYDRAYEKNRRTRAWLNVVEKTAYRVDILMESESREFIIEKEKEFISLYGRRDLGAGTLVNFTDGGEGNLGLKISEESRLKRSIASKGRGLGKPLSKEHKQKISASLKEARAFGKGGMSPAALIRFKQNRKGHIVSEETRQKIREKLLKPKPPKIREGCKFTAEGMAKLIKSHQKPVYCVNTHQTFDTVTHAAKALGISQISIYRVLSGSYSSVKGLKFLRPNGL